MWETIWPILPKLLQQEAPFHGSKWDPRYNAEFLKNVIPIHFFFFASISLTIGDPEEKQWAINGLFFALMVRTETNIVPHVLSDTGKKHIIPGGSFGSRLRNGDQCAEDLLGRTLGINISGLQGKEVKLSRERAWTVVIVPLEV